MKSDDIGGWLRFITPIMIVLIGFLGNMAINDMKKSLSQLDNHFTNHLSDHKTVEVMIADRLARIETKLGPCIK